MPSSSRRMPGGALVHSLMKQRDFRNSKEWPPEKHVTLSVKLISAGVRLNFSALRTGRPPVCVCFFAGRFKRVSLRSGWFFFSFHLVLSDLNLSEPVPPNSRFCRLIERYRVVGRSITLTTDWRHFSSSPVKGAHCDVCGYKFGIWKIVKGNWLEVAKNWHQT